VKHLCRATRSEVTLVSDRGKGSTFTLRLPRM
jgi:signal transduction histidine kinase